MPKTTVSLQIESSGYDLMLAFKAVAVAAKAGGAPAALAAALTQVVSAVAAIEALPADVKEDEAAFIQGAVVASTELILAVLGVA